MALLIELAPKLLAIHEGGLLKTEVNLETGDLYKQFRQLNMRFTIFAALGGNIGNEIEKILQRNRCIVEKVSIKDDSKIDSKIVEDKNVILGISNNQKITFDDSNNIKTRYVSALYNEDIVLLPITDITKEFAPEFISKAKDYYKKSVIYGSGAGSFLKYEPDIAILTYEDVVDLCPFKIESDYELIKFSFSLVEEKQTRVIIICKNMLLFYKDGVCYKVEEIDTQIEKTVFAVTIALQNQFDKEELVQFIAAANTVEDICNLASIGQKMKSIKIGVYRR